MSDSTYTDREVLWPASERPTVPVRPMPTADHIDEIRTIAEMYSGDLRIYEVRATSGGVLVSYSRDVGSPSPALVAVGYRVQPLREGLLLVTGAVDAAALITAQIEALAAERERLERAELERTTGAPF
ncbi:hypothetical protein SUDANB121_05890 (plasmid) [Nocardiopsis dassonvillei]|uniref:hypothetical protein n=1 Tax=Nocardiopsis dassonvillei TaxID=2014 RepID=UPI003F56D7E6